MTTNWDRLRAYFEAAVELPERDRPSFLDSEVEDPELRRELEALLSITQRRLDALEPDRLRLEGSSPAHAIEPGDRLDSYRILEFLGAGGIGTVFKARDEEHDRDVAIKLVPRELFEESEKERRLLGRLSHPGIATLYGSGTTEQGEPYVALEYVDGVALDRYCFDHELDFHGRLRLLRAVCEAVDFMHRRFVVHRDLKPQNVLVREDGAPKVLDFGIGRLLPEGGGSAEVTARENRLGTFGYASPEQIQGEPTGPASDIFSLGILLCELLTGRRPFEGEGLAIPWVNREATRPSELLGDGGAAGLPKAEVPEVSKALRSDLDHVVLCCIRQEPAERYASAGELARDLDRFLGHQPVQARRGSLRYRARKLLRRRRNEIAAGIVAAATLVALLVTWSSGRSRVASERQRADAALRTLEDAFGADQRSDVVGFSGALASAEIYDPETGEFTATGSMTLPRWDTTAVLLRDGRVLVLGGRTNEAWDETATAELFDPVEERFTPASPMLETRLEPFALVEEPDGAILAVGGNREGTFGTATDLVERYVPDRGIGRWELVGRLSMPRREHAVLRMPGGAVLAIGGDHSCCTAELSARVSSTAELFDVRTGTSTRTWELPMPMPRARAVELSERLTLVVPPAPPNDSATLASTSLLFDGERFSRADEAESRALLAELGGIGTHLAPLLDEPMRLRSNQLLLAGLPMSPLQDGVFFSRQVELTDGRYLAWSRSPDPVDVSDLDQTESSRVVRTLLEQPDLGAVGLLRETPLDGKDRLAIFLAHLWSSRGLDLHRGTSALHLESGDAPSPPDFRAYWSGASSLDPAAPGPERSGVATSLVSILTRPEGVCGVADTGSGSDAFVLHASRISAEQESPARLVGTLDYYPRNDGSILRFEGEVVGDVFSFRHTGADRRGRTSPWFLHRVRRLASGRLEGTLVQFQGENPAAGVVWLDPSEQATRLCRKAAEEAATWRRSAIATSTLGRFERHDQGTQPAVEVADTEIRGLWLVGDSALRPSTIPFGEVCDVAWRPNDEGCVEVVRRRRGGVWTVGALRLEGGSAACSDLQRSLRRAWTSWRGAFARYAEPDLTCSERAARLGT